MPFRNFLISSFRYSSDLLLPPLCLSCRSLLTGHNLLCARCWRTLHLITPPVCDRYGTPLPGVEGFGPHLSSRALAQPPVFDRARAAAYYSGIIRQLIVRLKFEDRHEPLPFFVKLMGEAGRDLIAGADVLMPVPLHRLRLLQRRFNQSALLAQGLSRATGVPVDLTGLRKIRRTRPQVGLTQDAREKNVSGAFALSKRGADAIKNRAVLLIDDVMTTGATANALAQTLKAADARRVDVLTIASTNADFAATDSYGEAA